MKTKTIKLGAKPKMKTVDLRGETIEKIKSHVQSMCNYAMENQCVEPSQFEELEWMLARFPRG